MPRAVLFDFYGTLTTACTRGPAHSLVPRLLGCDPADYFAVLDTSFYPRCRGAHGDALDTMRWVVGELGVRVTPARLRAAQAARLMAVRADTHLRPEAVPTLWRLRRAGVRLAVVSDCAWELPEIMRGLPIGRLLDAKVYSVHVGQSKPHPRMYLTACEQLGVEPERCVFVGDGGSRELTGARALGMRAIRLAAPDLADHLQYASDDGFTGESAPSLPEAAALATAALPAGAPASGPVPGALAYGPALATAAAQP
ncbi:HAD-IA family hydrolase [Catellatospora sp. NPDC049609]|uniref:HAD family hydrolase n=1 Tax=Catellatospora sp. NPDC049609 TaxID=3155505 RepID=UPI00343C37C3